MKRIIIGVALISSTGCTFMGQVGEALVDHLATQSPGGAMIQAAVNTDQYKAQKAANKAQLAQYKTPTQTNTQPISTPTQPAVQDWGTEKITPNTYGPGQNSDQYGRNVKYEVIGQPKADTTTLQVKPKVYGDQGADQYGRPVKLNIK